MWLASCTNSSESPSSVDSVDPNVTPTPLPGFEHASGEALLSEGRRIHEAAGSLSGEEQIQEFETALLFFEAAYRSFEARKQIAFMAETLAARSLTLRRLERFEEALPILQTALRLTKRTGGEVIPLFNLAKVQQALGNPICVQTYQDALVAMDQYRPYPHYREAVLRDMEIHLALAQLEFDQDPGDAEQRILTAIEALVADPNLDEFGRMVWVSGGYMGLARYYRELDAAQAWLYFDQAEAVIHAYPDRGVLRRQDLEVLRAEMPPRP